MKIGIDIRNFSNLQENFLHNFLIYLGSKDFTLNIYSNNEIEWIKIIKSKNFNSFFWEQILFLSKLIQDKNDIVITFNDTFPIFYNKKFIQIITSLEKLLYPNINNSKSFRKHSYQNILKSNLKQAQKIICFDEKTKKDINEKLNIDEVKIEIISPFFYEIKKPTSIIDIKSKHSLNWEYLLYNSWVWINKNLKRLFESISKTNINMIFLGNNISNDLETREMIIQYWLKDKIIFAWEPDEKEIWLYYKQSLGIIFPLLYSSFPFSLNDAVNFNAQIIASDIDEIRNIFWNKINYFSPISTIEIIKSIENLIKSWKKEINYNNIIQKYTIENFTNNFINLCQI